MVLFHAGGEGGGQFAAADAGEAAFLCGCGLAFARACLGNGVKPGLEEGAGGSGEREEACAFGHTGRAGRGRWVCGLGFGFGQLVHLCAAAAVVADEEHGDEEEDGEAGETTDDAAGEDRGRWG